MRLVVGVLTAATFVEGAIDVLVVVVALELLDLGSAGVGWLNAAWGPAGSAGGVVALLHGAATRRLRRVAAGRAPLRRPGADPVARRRRRSGWPCSASATR